MFGTSRVAQRAFRERKQSRVAELQARVQQYEQGEIERNVALQNIAKRLKEENEALRRENRQLKEQLLTFEQDLAPLAKTYRKRNRTYSPLSDMDPSKKSKPCLDPAETHVPLGSCYNNPSPRPMIISSVSNDTPDSLSSEGQADVSQSPILNLWQFPPAGRLAHLDGMSFDCGFCREDTSCVCREFVPLQAQVAQSGINYKVSNTYELPSASSDPNPQPPRAELIHPCTSEILEKLPDYQPPVPLRRKPASSSGNTVFAVAPPTPQPVKCSGDPSNCVACADDAFGKAFCVAIKDSVSKSLPCLNCTCEQGRSASESLAGFRTDSRAQLSILRVPPVHPSRPPEKMPTNEAWRQLKSHPNVAFTDLSLLADVVTRRSRCDASMDIPPTSAPGTLESVDTPLLKEFPIPQDDASVTETDKERNSSPKLVPQDVLLRCARRRVHEVETDAVRAALRILDAKFV